jgi:dihydroxy-acid dehydratase
VYDDDVIRPLDKPVASSGGTAILYGNLAPDGCVIKPPAAEPRLLRHTGRPSCSTATRTWRRP